MRVLAIMGSPRRNGTGDRALEQIVARMRERGPVELDVVRLQELDLGQCRGCFQCVSRGEGHCPMRGEIVPLEHRMEMADGIVLVSPGYVQNVSGLMKNFMDRMAYTNHRPRFFGSKVMTVANGGAGLDLTLEALGKAIGGPEVVSQLAYVQMPWPMGPKALEKRTAKLKKAADRFYEEMVGKDKRPSFANYMRFRFFKKAAQETGAWLPADRDYYQALGGYYYDVKISWAMKAKAALVLPLGMFFMKDLAPWEDENDGAEHQ